MAYHHENIIVGAADVYLGDADAALPTLVAGTSARAAFEPTLGTYAPGWRNVGLTTGGVEFSYSPDFGEVEVDQYLDVAKMFKQRQSVTVNTTFAEATLSNLLFAWGQSASTLTGTAGADGQVGSYDDTADAELNISAGNLGDAPEERQVVFIGQAPAAPGARRERVYHLTRALSVEASSFSLSRSEATTIPVSLRCLPSSMVGGGTYGRIIERTLTTA